ncbi:MAG: hypothetical protein A2Y00_00175 [Omnitrophica WOR_2 bacterium GWF2_43_52]|nr:MAG: hypothetical protein A2062_02060 [Omnitrophica WOR_2 bacterium GWA2_44_7]OGX20690.1 MAG: hypothetical protein A2Y00_00175 [Omnitrophica WOR_2 bacterium GWF2_43_52]HAH21308.1 hypothetical protein [Candidatus Omnitrophota bacterium]HBG64281.1 hypothetical protein [Candidatus Omnitrophota bacterium]
MLYKKEKERKFIPTLSDVSVGTGRSGQKRVGRDSAPKGQEEKEPQALVRAGSIRHVTLRNK